MGRLHTVALLLPLLACQDDPPEVVRKTIGAEGGLVSSHDRRLTIVLQPGALDSDTEIIIFPSEEPPPIFGAAYRVQPDIDLRVDAEVTYRRPLPPLEPRAVAVGAIKLDTFASGMGHWQPLPRLVLDLVNESVTASDDQLSLYYGMFDFNSLVGDDGGETEDVPTGCDVDITPCFTGFDYIAGSAPSGVCFGDFNGDGRADVATANGGSNTVSVLFGDGLGALGPANAIAVGDGPTAIACAPIDPGPHFDFVVALAAGSIIMAINEGEGTSFLFLAPVAVAAGPVGLQLIDLDNDGDLDVPVVSSSGAVTALNFMPPDLIALGEQATSPFVAMPTGLAVANFNVGADQNPDVFVFGGQTAVAALGAGNGSFGPFNGNTEFRIGSALAKGVAADVNGDANADVLIADAGMGGVHILESAGNGVDFQASFIPTGAGASAVAVGDFNGDGTRFDIAVANATAGTVTVLIRFGMEWINAGDLPTGAGASGIAVADVNLDGTQDIVVSNATDGTVTLLFSTR